MRKVRSQGSRNRGTAIPVLFIPRIRGWPHRLKGNYVLSVICGFSPEDEVMSFEKGGTTINKTTYVASMLLIVLMMGGQVFANPSLLPKYPGYPMDTAKSPVTGQSLVNDPGQSALSVERARNQAAGFHDSQVINPSK